MGLKVYNMPEKLPDGCWYGDNGEICMPLTLKQDCGLFAMLAVGFLIDILIFVGAFSGNAACTVMASIMIAAWVVILAWLVYAIVNEFHENRSTDESAQ